MELAIAEASKSESEDGRIHPKVGTVVVADERVLASAYRGETVLGEHAEFIALERKLSNQTLEGTTVYTTIEPCTIRASGKLSCTERLLGRRVARVVIGMLDPNPKLRGSGILRLRQGGVEVDLFPEDLLARIIHEADNAKGLQRGTKPL